LIGERLGHFRITAKLGEGGMGEVYRAEDERLGREVAVKVLPQAFVADPERLARFEREARLLASLSHPNIAALHEVGEEGEVRFLVMELASGEALSDRLARGAMPTPEALVVALQVARALEAAHERGIVHRDLKPANLVVDPRGAVKVLDFGLARAMEAEAGVGGSAALANSPTMTYQPTQAGVLLGTAAYMSPEQARGEVADRRADIWALGVVLWEMLAGRRLFEGRTVSDTLAAVLRDEVDLAALPADTPPALARLLRRLLERDPERRLHDVADARIVLEDLVGGVEEVEGTAAAPAAGRQSHGRPSVAWWAAALLAVALAAGLGYTSHRPTSAVPEEPKRLAIHLATNQELATGAMAPLAFAPDGRSLVVAGIHDGRQVLLRRELGDSEARPVGGTEEGDIPFYSPDGRWLGFVSRGRLKKVAVEGGRPFELAESRGSGGAAWLADDTLVFAPMYSDGLFRVSAAGGEAERLTTPDREAGELGHWWPQPLPGIPPRYVVFTAFRTPVDRSRVGLLDLETKEIRWLVEGGFFGRWVESGHLLYAHRQRLFAAPFDAETRSVTGRAVAVLDDLLTSQTAGYAAFAVSSRGDLAFVSESGGNPPREIVWIDRQGVARPALPDAGRYLTAAVSPDGRSIALTIEEESRDLWLYSLDRGILSRLTSGPETEFAPVWSRDGRELFYVVDRPPFTLYRIAVGTPDGGRPIFAETADSDTTQAAVSPDGRTLVFTLTEEGTGDSLYTRALDGDEPARPFRVTRAQEVFASFSPDGRWLTYQSDETGRPEVYVEEFPGPGQRFQVSAEGGTMPVWAASGEIFYLEGQQVWAVATRREGEGLQLARARPLFSYPIAAMIGGGTRRFDVSADGQAVLAGHRPELTIPRRIEVVTGWARQLAERVR
jgi:eukaryotic-like serine/threonine-protein kinase